MEKILKLYTYVDGVHDTPFPNEESQAEVAAFRSDYKRMGGAPSISCTIMHHLCLDKMWTYNVYATFNGEKFFIKQIPSSSFDNTNARYKHEVELVSERIVLDNVYFYDVVDEDDYSKPVSNSTSFTFFGDIHEFAHRLNQSLKYSKVGYNVVVDDGISSEAKQVSFQDQVFSNVLQEAFNTYEIPYYFDGKTIHIGFTNNAITKTFKYGSDESLLSIQKQNANYKIVNRVTGVGSSDNIPYYYPNFDEKGVTRLLYNGEVGGVSVTNKTRYKKVKLGDTFVYDANPTITKELFNKKDYKLGYYSDLYTPEEEELEPGFTRFQVQFSYSFYLNEMQQVRLELNSLSDNSIRIDFTVVRQEGGYMEQFFDKNHFEGRLGQGTYNVLITWEFKDTMSPNAIQDWQMKEIIDRDFVAYGDTIKQGYVSWMYNNAPVRLYDYGMEVNVEPNDGDKITFERVSYLQPQESLMPSIYRETNGENRFYNALNNTYVSPQTGEYYHFNNPYINGKPKEHIVNFEDIKPTIKGMTNSNGLRIDMFTEFAYDLNDNDEFDEEGNYLHPYFFGKLRRMDGAYGFNLFDHAIEEGEMVISMTSGSCGSCEWIIGVSEDRQENIVQVDERGNLLRDANGNVLRSGSAQPQQNDTINNEVWIALKKDISTFGVVMPNANANYKPQAGDTFVILHIDLPQAYILDAENRLKEELIKYMATNNDEKFNFSISFSRIFFAENPDILAQLNENARLQIEYDGERYELYVSSYSYSMSDGNPLPEIRVELTDTITVSQNAIQTAIDSVKQDIMSSVGSIDFLKMGLAYFLRKDVDDRSKGKISSDKAIEVGNYVSGASGAIIYKDEENGQTVAEFDKLYVRMKAYFETLEIINVNTIGGKQIISPAGSVRCIGVEETDNAYRCYFLAEQDGEKVQNRFLVYDQIYSQMFDAVEGTSQNVSTHYFWRLCIAKSKEPVTFENKSCHYIDLSKTDCDKDSDVPMVGDVLNQRGNRTDLDRMNFIEMSSVDAFSPNITLFHGVNSYSLDGKAYVSYGVDKSTNKAFMDVYGDMYVGDRQNSSYMRYTQENGLEISGTLSIGTKLGDTPLKDLISASSPEGYQEFVEKVTQDIEGLQAQIDGAIESYFFQYDPTLGNYPASEWIANGTEKAHLNDTFTNLANGYSWRWSLDGTTYKWVEITDTATTKALALAGQAKDTADGKRRVFVDTPYPPYDKGDLWSRGSEYPLMICVKEKDKNGVYEASDFDYADNNAKLKEEMQDLVGETKDELNNAIGQAKNEAVNNAKAYTDEGKKALQASIDAMESTKANLDDVYTRAQADGKISETEAKALKAAEEEADAAIAYYDTIVKAYADGVATEEELKEIQGAKAVLDAAKKYAEEQAQIAIDEANDAYGYLAKALDTEVDGGLLLTSLIQMRDTDQNIMSGINGLTAKGDKSIATWWGGGMYDMFDYYDWDGAKWVAKKNIQIPSNVPSGVIRMDGTGYLAKGKFWWDDSGKIYADPTALFLMFDVEDESASLSQTILAMRDKQTEFADMWEFKTDANGRKYLLSKYPLVTQEGITMYSGVGTTIPSIYDGLPIDGTTIYWENGILKAQGGGGGTITEVTSAMVINALGYTPYDAKNPNGFITSSALSGYQPLITSSNKLAYSLISGTPTLLSSFTNDSGFITSSALNDYLPLSGGTLSNILWIESNESVALSIRSNIHDTVAILFRGKSGNLGRLTMSSVDGQLYRTNANWSAEYRIWDSGNFKPSDYLPINANATSASKLQTARTIWGQSFDGTGNIDGDLYLLNNKSIKSYKSDNSASIEVLRMNASNSLVLGNGSSAINGELILDGYNIYMRYGKTHVNGLYLDSSGKIGIGTTNPAHKLDVNGEISATRGTFGKVRVNKGSDNHVGDQTIETSISGDMLYLQYYHNGGLSICKGGGNVGIGNTAPAYTLDVSGTFNASSNASVGGTLSVTGTSTFKSVIASNVLIGNSQGYNIKTVDGGSIRAVYLDTATLHLGTIDAVGVDTYVTGKQVSLRYGSNAKMGLTLASDGNVNISQNLAVSGSATLKTLSVNGGSLTYDSTNRSWKLNGNLLVTGGIAMYSDGSDIGGGGTGGGGSIDYPLKWSGFSSGSYDGSSTQTIYIPSKLSELTNDSGYALSSTLSGYLPLSGGTIKRNNVTLLVLNNTGESSIVESGIRYEIKGAAKAWIGYNSTYGAAIYNYTKKWWFGLKDDGSLGYSGGTIYHSGNFNPSNYVPLTGGVAMTGTLAIKTSGTIFTIRSSNGGTPYINFRSDIDGTNTDLGDLGVDTSKNLVYFTGGWKKVWHEGNFNPSDYLPLTGGTLTGSTATILTINRTSGNPIIRFLSNGTLSGYIGVQKNTNIPIWVDSSSNAHEIMHAGNIGSQSVSYASSAGEASGLKSNNKTKSETKLSFYASFVPKGNTTDFSWCSPTGSYTSGSTAGEYMGIIRINMGNGTTKYYHDLSFDMNSGTPQWRQVISGVSQGWRIFAFEDSNVASATKLQTARTIWGQSFDGSGNVTGVLKLGTSYITGSGGADILNSQGQWCDLGAGTSALGYNTYIDGYNTVFRYGKSHVVGMYLNSSGNVGIGRSDPKEMLHVAGNTRVDGFLYLLNNKSIHSYNSDKSASYEVLRMNASNGLVLGNGSSAAGGDLILDGNYIYLRCGSTHTNAIYVNNSGNVGIGTTNPTYKLDVSGTIRSSTSPADHILLRLNNTTNSIVMMDYLIKDVRKASVGYNGAYSYFINRTSGSFYATYDDGNHEFSGGKVGIGTNAPLYKLDVNGTIYTNSRVVSPYFMAGPGVEGLYMGTAGISWHDATYSYKASLISFTSNSISLQKNTSCAGNLDVTGTTVIRDTLSVAGKGTFTDSIAVINDISIGGNAIFANGRGVCVKNTSGTVLDVLKLSTSNNLVLGRADTNTYIDGYNVYLRYGTSYATGFTLASDGKITIANSANIGGALTASSTLSVSGASTFNGLGTFNASLKTYNSSGGDTYIELNRNANASWQILNSSGDLKFRNNWVNNKKGDYFDAFRLNYQTGNAWLKGSLEVASTSTFTGKTTHNGGIDATSGTFSSTLSVTGAVTLSSTLTMNNNKTFYFKDTSGNSVSAMYTSTSNNLIIGNGHRTSGYSTYLNGSAIYFRCNSASTTIAALFNGSGNFTLGSSNLARTNYKLYVDGNVYISSNLLTGGSITMNSMRSMKNIINENWLSLEELSTIKPTRFTWKDGRDNRIHVGGIADDVMKVLPEVVFKGNDGVLSMDYASAAFVMAASLIQPMTEHERRIANLERENALLKEEIRNLKSA